MKTNKTSSLIIEKSATKFYEDRYKHGYMEEWPIEKKQRVFEVIQSLNLPPNGSALDYGCGNGIFTEVIRQALPSWKVTGTDISNQAIVNAKARFPDCAFIEKNELELTQNKYDFILTHHVFEHVFNLEEVFSQMNDFLSQEASMLHILPCGNKGSYEYEICTLRSDGINKNIENRFFFEDEGHVRRLTSDQFCDLCQFKGFQLTKELYSNQYYGAINWITSSGPRFVLDITDDSLAINIEAKNKLKNIRIKLLTITVLRYPAIYINRQLAKNKKKYLQILLAAPFYILSKPIDNYWKNKAAKEWVAEKTNRQGSEMYLFFTRTAEEVTNK